MSSIDISYMRSGAQAGHRVVVDGIGLRLLSFNWLRHSPTSKELRSFSGNLIRLLESLDAVPKRGESSLYELTSSSERETVIRQLEASCDKNKPAKDDSGKYPKVPPLFVKYLSTETYEKYAKQGSFKIGSLIDYRYTPNPAAQDPLEGYCNLYFRNRSNYILASVFGGENLHIYCGSSELGSDYMKQKFGPVQLVLQDVTGFGNAVAKHLGAVKWEIRPVSYGSEKVWRLPAMNQSRLNMENIDSWIRCPMTMRRLHQFLVEEGPPGTVFYKPSRYASERELRFAFYMEKDIGPPFWRNINEPKLLDFFEAVLP